MTPSTSSAQSALSDFRNLRTITISLIFILTVGYFIADACLKNDDVNIAIDVILGVTSTMALLYYVGRAFYAVWTASRAHIDYLIVAIALSWWSQDGQAWLRVISRLSNFDPAFVNSEFFGLLKLGSVIAAILHVMPRGAADGRVPRTNSAVVVGCLAFAIALAGFTVKLRPDPEPLIKMMPAWTRDMFKTGDRRKIVVPPA